MSRMSRMSCGSHGSQKSQNFSMGLTYYAPLVVPPPSPPHKIFSFEKWGKWLGFYNILDGVSWILSWPCIVLFRPYILIFSSTNMWFNSRVHVYTHRFISCISFGNFQLRLISNFSRLQQHIPSALSYILNSGAETASMEYFITLLISAQTISAPRPICPLENVSYLTLMATCW